MASSMSTGNTRPHVLILGAGLGGLTLAQSLRKQYVSFEIFERDKTVRSRATGWAIALHTILGDLKASLPDDLPPIESTNHLLPLELPAELCFYSSAGKASAKASQQHPVVRANRQKLRELFATNIDVQWDKLVSSIEQDEEYVRLTFTDGTTATGDVLVGADGVSSHGMQLQDTSRNQD